MTIGVVPKEFLTTNNTIDLQLAIRVVKVIMTPFEDLDAYKLGIIDKNGNQLKKSYELKTVEEKKAYSPLMKILIRVKQLFIQYNVKRAQAQPFVTMAGALKYIRENENFVGFENFIDSYKPSHEELELVKSICEDMGTTIMNVSSIPPTSNTPVVPSIKNKYTDRNKKRRPGPDSITNGGIVRRSGT
jgi:hypothetical protein